MTDSFGGAGDRVGCFGWKETLADLGEGGDHVFALGCVAEQRYKRGGEVFGGEVRLQQLRDDASTGDEVDHGDGEVAVAVCLGVDFGRVFDEELCQREGQGRDSIDHDERVADDGSLYRCSAAGDDRGAGVVERLTGVGD